MPVSTFLFFLELPSPLYILDLVIEGFPPKAMLLSLLADVLSCSLASFLFVCFRQITATTSAADVISHAIRAKVPTAIIISLELSLPVRSIEKNQKHSLHLIEYYE